MFSAVTYPFSTPAKLILPRSEPAITISSNTVDRLPRVRRLRAHLHRQRRHGFPRQLVGLRRKFVRHDGPNGVGRGAELRCDAQGYDVDDERWGGAGCGAGAVDRVVQAGARDVPVMQGGSV